MYCWPRTKVVRGNRVSNWFQESSGHNFLGNYFPETKTRFRNFQNRPETLWKMNRRSIVFPLLYFMFLWLFPVSVFSSHCNHLFKYMPWLKWLLDWLKWWSEQNDQLHINHNHRALPRFTAIRFMVSSPETSQREEWTIISVFVHTAHFPSFMTSKSFWSAEGISCQKVLKVSNSIFCIIVSLNFFLWECSVVTVTICSGTYAMIDMSFRLRIEEFFARPIFLGFRGLLQSNFSTWPHFLLLSRFHWVFLCVC